MNLRAGFDPVSLGFGLLSSFATPRSGPAGSIPGMTQDQVATQSQTNVQSVNIGSSVGQPSALGALSNSGVLGLPTDYSLPAMSISASGSTPWMTYALWGGAALLVGAIVLKASRRNQSRAIVRY